MPQLWISALRHLLLYQASLVQYARFAAAQRPTPPLASPVSPVFTNSTNSTTPAPSQCTACVVSVLETVLTYPSSVSLEVQNVTATVIPYVTQYDNGTEITNYSTFTLYTANATSNSPFESPTGTPLTWETFDTTLTYPTTYLAFPSAYAGFSSFGVDDTTSSCLEPDFTRVSIEPTDLSRLVFPFTSTEDFAAISQSAFGYIDSLPSITSVLGGKDPHLCSQTIGSFVALASSTLAFTGTATSTASALPKPTQPLPVQHTTVAVLTTTGQPVVTKVPSLPDTDGSGSRTPGGQAGKAPGSGASDDRGGSSDGGAGSDKSGGTSGNNGGGSSNSGGGSGTSGGGSGNGGDGSRNGGGGSGDNQDGSGNGGGGTGNGSGGSGSNNGHGNSGNGGGGSGSGNGGSGSESGSGGGIAGLVNSVVAGYQQTQPGAVPATPTSRIVNIGSSPVPVAYGQNGAVVIGGVTLAPGASTVINGVTVSRPDSGPGIVVGGSSVMVPGTAGAGPGSPGVLTVGSNTVTAGPSGAFVVAGQTLTPGGSVVVSGTTLSLGPGGSVAVVNGVTQTIGPASAPSASATTTSGGVGGAVASGIGISPTSTGLGASKTGTQASTASAKIVLSCTSIFIALGVGVLSFWV